MCAVLRALRAARSALGPEPPRLRPERPVIRRTCDWSRRVSSAWSASLPVADLEARPENDGGTVTHAPHVLRGRGGALVNLEGYDLVCIHEAVDVAGSRRLPWHVVDVVLHAAAAGEAANPARAPYHISFGRAHHAKARYPAENIRKVLRMDVLELARP